MNRAQKLLEKLYQYTERLEKLEDIDIANALVILNHISSHTKAFELQEFWDILHKSKIGFSYLLEDEIVKWLLSNKIIEIAKTYDPNTGKWTVHEDLYMINSAYLKRFIDTYQDIIEDNF